MLVLSELLRQGSCSAQPDGSSRVEHVAACGNGKSRLLSYASFLGMAREALVPMGSNEKLASSVLFSHTHAIVGLLPSRKPNEAFYLGFLLAKKMAFRSGKCLNLPLTTASSLMHL